MRNCRRLCCHRLRLEDGRLVRLEHLGLGLLDHHLPGDGLDTVRAAAVEFSVTVRTSHLPPALAVLRLVSGDNPTENREEMILYELELGVYTNI